MQFVPRDYQKIIIDYILKKERCSIWAGMGLGKTVSTLAAISMLKLCDHQKVLVLAPLRVAKETWPTEVAKWNLDLTIKTITGTESERLELLKQETDITCINYEQIPWLLKQGKWGYTMVVADEATKLKSFRLKGGGQRAAALSKVAHLSERWVNLTGTPSPNGLQDLWGQQWFVDKGERLGRTYTSFMERWFTLHEYRIKAHSFAQRDIEERLADICLSIRSEDYFPVDKPIINDIIVELPSKARTAYEEMESELYCEIEGNGVESVNAAGKINKCLQIANGAAYTDGASWVEVHKAKLEALEEVIEEASSPVLVAYNFKSDLERLLKHFKQGKQLDANPQTIKDWNAGKIPILFAHPQSCGHGLNLQYGGNTLAFFGLTWNLEHRQQMVERIGGVRQKQAGLDRNVFIHNIIARNTVDGLVMQAINRKARLQDVLLESMSLTKATKV